MNGEDPVTPMTALVVDADGRLTYMGEDGRRRVIVGDQELLDRLHQELDVLAAGRIYPPSGASSAQSDGPERIGFHILGKVIRGTVSPLLYVALCILTKWCVIGKFTAGPRNRSEWNIFKHWLMSQLLPGKELGGVAHLIGSHYEGISLVYRMLGAKVGRHVYWPGSGIETCEYDLLEIGDDVTFGSRSIVMAVKVVGSVVPGTSSEPPGTTEAAPVPPCCHVKAGKLMVDTQVGTMPGVASAYAPVVRYCSGPPASTR